MAKEGAVSVVEEIRKALRESAEGGKGGAGMPDELFWVPQDGIKVVRFLSPLTNEGIVKVVMHDRFGKNNTGMMPQPDVNFRYIQASNGEGFIIPDTDQDRRQKEAIDNARKS